MDKDFLNIIKCPLSFRDIQGIGYMLFILALHHPTRLVETNRRVRPSISGPEAVSPENVVYLVANS